MPSPYTPMSGRAAQFRGSANWVIVLGALAALWFGFQIIFSAVFVVWASAPRIVTNPDIIDTFFLGSTPWAVRASLATFGIYTLILWGILRLFHQMRLRTLLGQFRPALAQFLRVSLYLSPLYLLLLVPGLWAPESEQQFSVFRWLLLLPGVLPLLFVQISAEELVFRGYLQSHLAALANHPLVWMLLPSLLFGLIHYDATAPSYSAWAYVVWATALGLICADLTARSGTLGPALAVHFVNNIAAMVILAADDWLFGASLFVWPTHGQPWEPVLPYDALALFVVWLTARLAIRR